MCVCVFKFRCWSARTLAQHLHPVSNTWTTTFRRRWGDSEKTKASFDVFYYIKIQNLRRKFLMELSIGGMIWWHGYNTAFVFFTDVPSIERRPVCSARVYARSQPCALSPLQKASDGDGVKGRAVTRPEWNFISSLNIVKFLRVSLHSIKERRSMAEHQECE